MTTLNKSDLQKFEEQSGLQVDGRSEFAYTDRLEQFSRLIRLDLELEITYLRDQLAKAGQRVAKWQPISTAPEDAFTETASDKRRTVVIQREAELEAEIVRLRSVMADVIKAHGYTGGTPIEVMSTQFTPTALNELIEKVHVSPKP